MALAGFGTQPFGVSAFGFGFDASLPVLYGKVTWRAVAAIADGADEGGEPNALPVTGTVSFTPSATILLAPNSSPPITVFGTTVDYQLDQDGVLRDAEGRDEISLVATDSPGITPTNWTWRVTYRLNDGLTRGSFSFALPTGETVDLTKVAPVSASNGVPVIQGERGAAGLSAYQVAVANGFVGTEAQWLASLAAGGEAVLVDASPTVKGVVRLAGDLGGTANAPTVPGLAAKLDTADAPALVAASLSAGANVTLNKNAATGVVTISSTGGGGGSSPGLIGLDTDGVPYFDPAGVEASISLDVDTDGVLYYAA